MKILILIPETSENEDVFVAVLQGLSDVKAQISRLTHHGPINMTSLIDEARSSDLVIVDLSGNDSNVMFETGLLTSMNIPLIPICQLGTIIPLDVTIYRMIFFDRDRLKDTLVLPLRNLINDESSLGYKPTLTETKKRKSVFVSYSHSDDHYLRRLEVHLAPFEKAGLIQLWSDKKIKAGQKWQDLIQQALEDAVIAILFISADFLASDFIVDNELPPLLKYAEEKGTVILPVIVKPCRFVSNKALSVYQAINDPKLPLSKLDDNDREEIYDKLAERIEQLIKI